MRYDFRYSVGVGIVPAMTAVVVKRLRLTLG